MVSVALLWAGLFSGDELYLLKVKEGYLDLSDRAHIGLVFSGYRWFSEIEWRLEPGTGPYPVVCFKGFILDGPAVEDFHENHQYAFRKGLMAMQLGPYYGLDKHKAKLCYLIRFRFTDEQDFAVESGELGMLDGRDNTWRYKPLPDKSLLKLIEGIYANENPYVSLIKGLPFK